MRILKNTLASAALAGLLAVQPVAAAAQAAPAIDRSGTALEGSEELRSGGIGPVFVVLGGFIVIFLTMEYLLDVIDVLEDPASP